MSAHRSEQRDEPMELASGRFELRERLGGGTGVVYAAYDRRRAEPVALKKLAKLDGAGIQRLKAEFRGLSSLEHPNLVRLRELFVNGSQVFFTMDLIEGVPLSTYIREAADLDHQVPLRDVFRQLAEGLVAIHASGRLHRGLKPSSVMLQRDGRVVIVDFGVTGSADPRRAASLDEAAAGTHAYMAPEQALGRPVSIASDWYAFGAMLHEKLAPIQRPDAPSDLVRLALLLLAREPESRPSGAHVLGILGSLDPVEPESARPAASSRRPTFIGREAELLVLEHALHRTVCGELVSVLVSGASGIGKTTLVREFLKDDCRAKGALILESKCFEHESVRYNALDGIIDGLATYLRSRSAELRARVTPRRAKALVTLFPVLDDVLLHEAPDEELPEQPGERRHLAFQALRELLSRVSELVPLVLFADDLHWGDQDSARLLSVLLAPPEPPGLLLIGACRSDERSLSPLLRALDTEAAEAWKPIEVEVGALSLDEATRLSLRLLGDEQRELAEAIAVEGRGNPFFLLELSLAAQQLERDVRGASLAELILWRVQSLPETARDLLQIVVLAQVPVAARLLEAAVGLPGPAGDSWLALKRSKLVRSLYVAGDERLLCYHDRIRETVANAIEPERAKSLHGQLARVLELDPTAEPERLAEHFRRADDLHSAALYAERAGDAARANLAFARAAEWYVLAFELCSDDQANTRRLRVRLAEALEDAGRARDAARHYMDAAAEAKDEVAALDFRRRAASQLLGAGHADEGLRILQSVLSAAGLGHPMTLPGAVGALLWERSALRLRGLHFDERRGHVPSKGDLLRVDALAAAAAGYLRCDFVRGAMFASKELRYALATGDITRIARGLANELLYAANEGVRSGKRVAELHEMAARLLPRVEDERVLAYLQATCAASHLLLGNAGRAAPGLRQAERLLAQGRSSRELTLTRFLWALCMQITGGLIELTEPCEAWLADARERADLQAERYFAIHRSFALLVLDQPDAARDVVVRTLAATQKASDDFMRFAALHAFVLIAVYRKDAPDVVKPLLSEHQKFWRSPLRGGQLSRTYVKVYMAYCLLVMAAHTDARTRDTRSLHRATKSLMKEGVPYAEAHGRLVRAAALRLEKRTEDAAIELAAAAALFGQLGHELQAGAASYQLGNLLGGQSGAALVDTAIEDARALGVANPSRLYEAYTPGFWP